MLLLHAFNMFLMDRCTYCSDKTILYYKENVNQFLNYLADSSGADKETLECSMINRQVIQQYQLHLRALDIKNTTINTYFRAVKAFINYCIEESYVEADSLRKIKMLRSDQEPITPLYNDEVTQLDAVFNMTTETGVRNYCIVHLMLDAGFRSSDVVNLKVSDIFFDKNCLQVKGKGSKYRSVLLAPKLKRILYKYLIVYRPFVFDKDLMQQPVFVQVGTKSDFINGNCIKQLFQRLKKKTGIKRLHPHLLRHTFATSYILGGGNLEFLRMMLGHSDYETTKLYLHLAQEAQMLKHDIYKLDPIFFRTVY